MNSLLKSISSRAVKGSSPYQNLVGLRRIICSQRSPITEQLLDEVGHDIMNYQNRGLCYLPKPKAEADNTDTRFW